MLDTLLGDGCLRFRRNVHPIRGPSPLLERRAVCQLAEPVESTLLSCTSAVYPAPRSLQEISNRQAHKNRANPIWVFYTSAEVKRRTDGH